MTSWFRKRNPREVRRLVETVEEKAARWARDAKQDKQAAEADGRERMGEGEREREGAPEAGQGAPGDSPAIPASCLPVPGDLLAANPLLPPLSADLPPWDQPIPAKVMVDSGRLGDLLLAGWLMVEWLLEERGEAVDEGGGKAVENSSATSGRPRWCLLCGSRSADARLAENHLTPEGDLCPVARWVRGAKGIEVETVSNEQSGKVEKAG